MSPVDLSRGSLIKRGVWPLLVVEADVAAKPTLQGRRAVVAPQVDVLVLQRPPQSLDEDIVEGPATAIHTDQDVPCLESLDPLGTGELRALIGIEDQRLTLIEGRIQCFDAEAGVERVRQAHETT